jgi:hypothetical protein
MMTGTATAALGAEVITDKFTRRPIDAVHTVSPINLHLALTFSSNVHKQIFMQQFQVTLLEAIKTIK